MRLAIYSADFANDPVRSWAWGNGSEDFHQRLAKGLWDRGHDAYSFWPDAGNTAHACREFPKWLSEHPDTVILAQRSPLPIQELPKTAERYLLCHDIDYQGLDPEFWDGLLVESQAHASYLRSKYPTAKVFVTGNGFLLDQFKLKAVPERNPKKVVYASCPSRGLWNLLRIWRRVTEISPSMELHCYYGWGTMERLAENGGTTAIQLRRTRKQCERAISDLGVHWHDRLTKPQLIQELHTAGLYAYPIGGFPEVFCCSVAEAQLCGVVPVVRPQWALGETAKYGVAIQGDPEDQLVRLRWSYTLASMASQPEKQEKIRECMVPDAFKVFDWASVLDRIEEIIGAGK